MNNIQDLIKQSQCYLCLGISTEEAIELALLANILSNSPTPPPPAGAQVFRALLTQTGTSNPTATVLENSLPGTPTFTRTGPGHYSATLVGAFKVHKTHVILSGCNDSTTGVSECCSAGPDQVRFSTFKPPLKYEDGHLNEAAIQIIVYP